MLQILWDASALSKRYYKEAGTEGVNSLFSSAATMSIGMLTSYWGYAETAAILRRKVNAGFLNMQAFLQARRTLDSETLLQPDFELLSVDDADVLAGIALTDRHNLNSTDAAILAAFLRRTRGQDQCVLVAADRRLLRAATAEVLSPLNPEDHSPDDLPDFLTSA